MTTQPLSRLEEPRQGSALFLLCWVAYAAAYVGRYDYSAVMGAMISEGALSLSAAGAVSTGYFLCYAGGQLLGGFLCPYLSPFRMIFGGLALSGVCNLGMSVAPPALLAAIWAVNGLLQAMIWPPIVRLFAECMPLAQQKGACVNINSTIPVGTFAAYGACALLLALASWQKAFVTCGLLMLAAAAFWQAATVRLRRQVLLPRTDPAQKQTGAGKQAGPGRSVPRQLLAAGLGLLILPVVLHGGLKDGVTSWVPSMVQDRFATSPAFAAAVSMAMPLVNTGGAWAAGWLDRRVFHNELKTVSALFTLASVCLALLPLAVGASIAASMLLLALVTASMLGINTMLINVMPVRAGRGGGAALLSGSLNAMTYAGAAAATWGFGAAAGQWGWSAVFTLWLVMAALGLAVSALCIRRWGRFAAACDQQTATPE